MSNPFEIVQKVIEALHAQDWSAVPGMVDLEDLAAWYDRFFQARSEAEHDLTAADIKRHQPDMPDEVAEYNAAQIRRQREEARGTLQGQFAGLDSLAELAALRPADALARYLQRQDPHWRWRRALDRLDEPVHPRLERPPFSQWRQAIGLVMEGSDVAHVVYRVGIGHAAVTADDGEIQVATLRRGPLGWRLRLRGELFEHGNFAVIVDAEEEQAEGGADQG